MNPHNDPPQCDEDGVNDVTICLSLESGKLTIRDMLESDCDIIADAFSAQGWHKTVSQYNQYWQDRLAGRRDILVAQYELQFAGYVTIMWDSEYPPFRHAHIPEIVDFNVLIKYRRMKIGTALMDAAERCIGFRASVAGLGVCLHADYGAAQVLYAKRGYVPDGNGVYFRGCYPTYGDLVEIGDDLTLYLTKRLRDG